MEELLTLKVLHNSVENVIYSIDTPRTGSLGTGKLDYIRFSGWLYALDGSPASFIFSHRPGFELYSNTSRTDVQRVHPEAPVECGVGAPVEAARSFKIGVKSRDVFVWVAEVEIAPAKVLRGRNRNLFLDHDANQSVAQYRGDKLIAKEEMEGWSLYFQKTAAICSELMEYAFMIAPAKEYVYPEDFPYGKGLITPLEQFVASFSDKVRIVNPLSTLIREKEFSYFKTDTHWTEYGAFLAAQQACAEFEVPFLSPDLSYTIQPKLGDLGSKVYPPQHENSIQVHNLDALKSFVIYDNEVPVRGNICIYENKLTSNKSTLLIFGDSFSVTLADILSYSFSRVVRVFSGADIDWAIIAHEKPRYILTELASRFLVRAPDLEFSILGEIQGKYVGLTNEIIEQYQERVADYDDSNVAYYAGLSADALHSVKITRHGFMEGTC